MAAKRRSMLDLREMLRRMREGAGIRAIARDLQASRNTVRGYRVWFAEQGLLQAVVPLPSLAELPARIQARQVETTLPTLAGYHGETDTAIQGGLQMTVAWQRFCERHPNVPISYSAFRRYVRAHVQPLTTAPVVRMEVAPGAQAQVDFGYVGLIPEHAGGQARKVWAFIMTLSHSRHQFVELVTDQSVATWLRLHRRAFECFGGVPAKVVLDNLKAGIIKACFTDPEAQRAYRELAEHYDFVISPCVARTPRHKGKVESGVKYLKNSLMAGRTFASLQAANAAAASWVQNIAGTRQHGTTQEAPLKRFESIERAALRRLLPTPFEIVAYRRQKLPRNCHVIFEKAFYSAPYTLTGKMVVVAATPSAVQIFHEHALVATHPRAARAGDRLMNPAHFPPEKMCYIIQTPAWCQARAEEIGLHTAAMIQALLNDRVDRLRGAQVLLRLAERYGPSRLEAACQRAMLHDVIDVRTVKTIMRRGLDVRPGVSTPVRLWIKPPTFARSLNDLFNPAPAAAHRQDL